MKTLSIYKRVLCTDAILGVVSILYGIVDLLIKNKFISILFLSMILLSTIIAFLIRKNKDIEPFDERAKENESVATSFTFNISQLLLVLIMMFLLITDNTIILNASILMIAYGCISILRIVIFFILDLPATKEE